MEVGEHADAEDGVETIVGEGGEGVGAVQVDADEGGVGGFLVGEAEERAGDVQADEFRVVFAEEVEATEGDAWRPSPQPASRMRRPRRGGGFAARAEARSRAARSGQSYPHARIFVE